jgi:hypothetical protein
MLSHCLHGDGWGVQGVEGVEEEVEEAGGRNGARVGSARRPATLDAQRSMLNRNADAEPQRQRRRVQSPDAVQGRAGQAASQGRQQKEAGPVGPGTCRPGTRPRRRAVVGRACHF